MVIVSPLAITFGQNEQRIVTLTYLSGDKFLILQPLVW